MFRSDVASRITRGLVLTAAFLVALPASAGALDQWRDFSRSTKAARGQFTQQTAGTGAAGKVESSSGSFAFQRPGKFRWQVAKPFEQLMVADGESLHFFDKDLNQVTVRSLKESVGSSPAAILFGTGELEKDFEVRDAGSRDGLDWFEATPKSKDAGFESIVVGWRDGLPAAMQVRDAFGRTTDFRFESIERNPTLAADVFRFVVPPGADVIRQ